jgi:hypothetical protein
MSEKIFDYMTIPEEYSPDVFGKGCMIQNVFIHESVVITLGLRNFGCDTNDRKLLK